MPNSTERSRKIHATLLQALADKTQAKVAEITGISEAGISRIKDDRLPQIALLLDALDLKVVPADARCYRVDYMEVLLFLAKEKMNKLTLDSFGLED